MESGRLNEDYSLNEDYEGNSLDDDEEAAKYFIPEKGEDYWDDGFDVEAWREDLSAHANLLRIAPMDPHEDPVIAMRSAFSYHFTNENLLRQAEGYFGWGMAKSKVKAKKKAAYMVIANMLISAGICEDEWHDKMVENMTSRE